MALKRPIILYYSAASMPNEAEIAEADGFTWGTVKFRNAEFADGICEPCDAVAGEVPPEYEAAGIPNAKDYKPARTTRATRDTAKADAAKAEADAAAAAAKAEAEAKAKGEPAWGAPVAGKAK
jgi:hypothetical protein